VSHPPPPPAAFPANGLPPDLEGEDPSVCRDEDTEVTRLFWEQISNGTLLRIETGVGQKAADGDPLWFVAGPKIVGQTASILVVRMRSEYVHTS
jgi:hypothetical protein